MYFDSFSVFVYVCLCCFLRLILGEFTKFNQLNLYIMNTQTELHGKIQICYLPTNRGVNICEIEKIDKYTEIRESNEGRFSLKVQIEDTTDDAIDFVYRQKLYISKEDATEIVNEFLTQN